MAVSVFDLFKIGIGPSSSHTVGPMKAARLFALRLQADGLLPKVAAVRTELFGSLGATGKGHGTDKAVILGLMGETPEGVDTTTVQPRIDAIREAQKLDLLGVHPIDFVEKQHILFRRSALPYHPNGMTFAALNVAGAFLDAATYYSVGGGFVVDSTATGADRIKEDDTVLPYPFDNAEELLAICKAAGLSISQVMLENEKAWRSEAEIRAGLLRIWNVMQDCVRRGVTSEGILPGGMKVKRRAAELYQQLAARPEANLQDPLNVMDWVNVYAIAVNEENAWGGRVVTAPTNGAAGIIPAVLHYYARFVPGATDDGVVRFLLTAGAIGTLYKKNASISGADVGCQGEVGVACSMAAGAYCAVTGGNVKQVEVAAEIGMEHNLGLTCDPVGGLVQIPCIERNGVAAERAVNCAQLSRLEDGRQRVISLDEIIEVMYRTGLDLQSRYKETSLGGLAEAVAKVMERKKMASGTTGK